MQSSSQVIKDIIITSVIASLKLTKIFTQKVIYTLINNTISSNNNTQMRGLFEMKKYMVLFFLTLLAFFTAIGVRQFTDSTVVNVDTINLIPTALENFVVCTGRVEYSSVKQIYANGPSRVKEAYVKVGDRVKPGQSLICISGDNQIGISCENRDNYEKFYGIEGTEDLCEVYSSVMTKGPFERMKQTEKEKGKSYTINSPIYGVVSGIGDPGGIIADSKSPVVTISDDDSLQVRLCVNEALISQINQGQKVIITGPGFKEISCEGVVKSISNEARSSINSAGAEAIVEVVVSINPGGENHKIKPGFTAKCKIITSIDKDSIVAPHNTVKVDENGQEYVYRYEKGIAVRTYINTGKEYESGSEVVSGLAENDQIIINPDVLSNNARVKLIQKIQ